MTTGSIEEKIFQRQLSKAGLNEAVVDQSHTSSVRLSNEELKVPNKLMWNAPCLELMYFGGSCNLSLTNDYCVRWSKIIVLSVERSVYSTIPIVPEPGRFRLFFSPPETSSVSSILVLSSNVKTPFL